MRITAWLFVVGLWVLLPAARPNPPAETAPGKQFVRLKQRIDALLKQRLHPEPLPVLLPNPFRVVNGSMSELHPDEADEESAADSGVETPSGAKSVGEFPPGSNREALARCIAQLKIGGTVALNGQLQVVINDLARKEGDYVVLDRDNAMSYLKVVRIRPGELTLGLKDVTQMIRF